VPDPSGDGAVDGPPAVRRGLDWLHLTELEHAVIVVPGPVAPPQRLLSPA
jgi:hypothetical protein